MTLTLTSHRGRDYPVELFTPDTAFTDTGAVYLFLAPVELGASLATATTRVLGAQDEARVGAAVALVGDQDGDGWGEMNNPKTEHLYWQLPTKLANQL